MDYLSDKVEKAKHRAVAELQSEDRGASDLLAHAKVQEALKNGQVTRVMIGFYDQQSKRHLKSIELQADWLLAAGEDQVVQEITCQVRSGVAAGWPCFGAEARSRRLVEETVKRLRAEGVPLERSITIVRASGELCGEPVLYALQYGDSDERMELRPSDEDMEERIEAWLRRKVQEEDKRSDE